MAILSFNGRNRYFYHEQTGDVIMEEMFIRLERQIRNLVDQQNQLQASNHQLNHSKGSLVRENEELLSRQEKAITTIEALVSRLKSIEKTS